ncbi:FAD-dependent oxidoreductase [Pendulispora rubella]|uniref:FAD-dependent oxidoreductase n=1 Tax=Pendulispora rubella TaxID=2741070 RepID=A0ABZ2L2Y7_9BACT
MARTDLFGRVARAMRTAIWLERRGVRREAGQLEMGRRQLLQTFGLAAGVATLGAALPACATGDGHEDGASEPGSQPSAVSASEPVVVVGAGLAGLTAAYRLAQRGRRVRVFDANNRVGGRTFTLRNEFDTKVEMGGEFIDTGHVAIQRLAGELGLHLVDLTEATSSLERERYFLRGERYTEAQIVEWFRPIARQLDEDYAAQGPNIASYDSNNEVQRRLDRTSIEEWFDRHRFHGPARAIIELAYIGEYGRETCEQSYLNLLYLISSEAPPLELFGDSDERFTVREGNDAIATSLAARLPEPVTLEHRLVALRSKSDGRVEVVLEERGRRVLETADHVVVAIPFTQLRKCEIAGVAVTSAQRRAIDILNYGTNGKLMLGMSSRPWVADGASGASTTDVAYQQSWDSSRGYPTEGAAMTCFSGGKLGLALGEGRIRDQAARSLAQLDRIFPGSAAAYDGKSVRMAWGTARHFEGSYACYAPGDWTRISGAEKLRFGNIHVAGEHTSTDFQGFMEGAVESGERAAAEVLAGRADA